MRPIGSDKPLYANFRVSAGLSPPKDRNQRKKQSRKDRGEVPYRMQAPDNLNARPFRKAKNNLTSPIRDFSEDSDVFLAYTRLCTKNPVIKVTPQSIGPIRPQNGLKNRPTRS